MAPRLLEMGYAPLPIKQVSKAPAPSRWTQVGIDDVQVNRWCEQYPHHGIGLRTGDLVGIDIDVLDEDLAHELQAVAFERLGPTLIRIGLWPKRMLLYRTDAPFRKMQVGNVEVLGEGQQFVAFGMHPVTGKAYDWPLGDTPLDVPLDALPLVDAEACAAFLSEVAARLPSFGCSRSAVPAMSRQQPSSPALRDASGFVVDHRDSWLSSIAYHLVWDALDAGGSPDPAAIAARVWARFAETADLTRGRQGGRHAYQVADARRKVEDKLRLAQLGHLPPRSVPVATPVAVDPGLPVEEARAALDATLADTCTRIQDWYLGGAEGTPPCIGIRASVGLGKTAASRRHLLDLRTWLKAAGLPHGIVVFTPSHVLAEETAAAWRSDDLKVAVHRGYEAHHPDHGRPMCQDLDMVKMSITSGLSVFRYACLQPGQSRCHAFDLCLKQDNLNEVGKADVVIAPYDALFTGLSVGATKIGVLLIDEGCWIRARQITQLHMHTLLETEALDQPRLEDSAQEEAAWKQLFEIRQMVHVGLSANGPGVVSRQRFIDAGLDADLCTKAAGLEIHLRADPGLRPGLGQGARKAALDLSAAANRSLRRELLFQTLARLLQGEADVDGRIRLTARHAETGAQEITVSGLQRLHSDFTDKPILHLDATLRQDIAETVLPGLEVTEITVAMPHMALTLVQGSFGKGTLVPDEKSKPEENARRANRLRECVDYVRWQARKVAPGKVLVVTYKDIEEAFSNVPSVQTAHFNAIAGLDMYKDVAALIVIGRPLPASPDLHPMVGAYFQQEPSGKYGRDVMSVPLRNGSRQSIKAVRHEDHRAETLRAAICDDEVIQAMGRGRGVNRTAANPLEVHVLADVALPMLHDRAVAWESIVPDHVQRMLLDGFAVDSPADAVVLHPGMFENVDQAKKLFQREAFKGQIPMSNTYRGMSLKSARYRRAGRGRSWQTVWWLDGTADDVRQRLVDVLGPIEGWEPN